MSGRVRQGMQGDADARLGVLDVSLNYRMYVWLGPRCLPELPYVCVAGSSMSP